MTADSSTVHKLYYQPPGEHANEVLDRIMRPPVPEHSRYNALRVYHLMNRGRRANRFTQKLVDIKRQWNDLQIQTQISQPSADLKALQNNVKNFLGTIEDYLGLKHVQLPPDGGSPAEQEEGDEGDGEDENEEDGGGDTDE